MGRWEHLFIDGEFMSRARLLSGLTVEQVSVRPPGLPHTIYEELWHTTKWQSIVVQCDEPAAAAWIDAGQDFPSEAPSNERMWEDLVTEFLAGLPPGAAADAGDIGAASQFFLASVRVTIGDAQARGSALLAREPAGGWPVVVWRKYP